MTLEELAVMDSDHQLKRPADRSPGYQEWVTTATQLKQARPYLIAGEVLEFIQANEFEFLYEVLTIAEGFPPDYGCLAALVQWTNSYCPPVTDSYGIPEQFWVDDKIVVPGMRPETLLGLNNLLAWINISLRKGVPISEGPQWHLVQEEEYPEYPEEEYEEEYDEHDDEHDDRDDRDDHDDRQ